MSRIVVDKKWWSDHRRLTLIKILKSEVEADGLALSLWKLGFDYWVQDRSKIPQSIYSTLPHCQILLDLNLAQVQGDQVYVRGATDRFEWFFKRSNAGKLGCEAIKKKKAKGLTLTEDNPPPSSLLTLPPVQENPSPSSDIPKLHILAELWNDIMPPPFPKVLKTSGQRLKQATLRWKENPNKLYWGNILEIITQSDFLKGLNDRSWVADFDFLIRPGTDTRILEGKYTRKPQSRLQTVSDFNQSQRQKWLFNLTAPEERQHEGSEE